MKFNKNESKIDRILARFMLVFVSGIVIALILLSFGVI